MIDTNLIKDDPQMVAKNLQSRNYDFNIESYESLEAQRKKHQTETEDLQAKRNSLSKEYGLLKKEGKDDPALNSKIESIKTELDQCSSKLNHIQSSLKEFLLDIPNLPAELSSNRFQRRKQYKNKRSRRTSHFKRQRSFRDHFND